MAQGSRPLSPHVQIYGVYLSMVFSFLHRITGFGIAAGLVLYTWWVTSLASGPESFATVQWVMQSWIGTLILMGFSLALFFHMVSGVRHFVFDTGRSLSKAAIHRSAIVIGSVTVGLTVLFWLAVFVVA